MNTQLDDHIDTDPDPTWDLPRTDVPVAPAITTEARRFDRTLLTIGGVGAALLIVGSIAVFGQRRGTDAVTATPSAPPAATVAPMTTPAPTTEPVAATETESAPSADDTAGEPAAVAIEVGEPAVEVVPDHSPAPVPTIAPVADEPAPPLDADDPEPVDADAGDPDPTGPEANPCVTAGDAGEQFFAPTDVVLDAGVLGGSFRIGSCTPEPLAIELTTVPGVLLSQSQFDLAPAGTDILFMIVPEFFEGKDIEFGIKVYEVDCCAGYVTVTAEKAWGLGELTPYDPGIFNMLAETDGIDPDDGEAVTEQFIEEYGWHPGYLDDPNAFLHDEALYDFIEQYGLESPWIAADN